MKKNFDSLIRERHTVRKYLDMPVSNKLKNTINERLNQLCNDYQVETELKEDGKSALNGIMAKLMSGNIENVIIFKGDQYHVGYVAAEIMLYIQSLGLNSWFIGGSINRKKLGEDVVAMIPFGYGQTNGKAHKLKKVNQVSNFQSNKYPNWFLNGVTACLLAPTALNKQSFYINYNNGDVQLHVKESKYSRIEAGILSYFFENASGHKLTLQNLS